MNYTVMSPWAVAESRNPVGITPRVPTLDGLTIGLYAHFKDQVPALMKTVGKLLGEKYPTAKFSFYQYTHDATEFINAPEDEAEMRKWLDGVDVVVAGLGDAGSCAMYLTYNLAYIEKLGKPTVTLVEPLYVNTASRGASARSVPGLRMVVTPLPLGYAGMTGDMIPVFTPWVEKKLGEIIAGLTAPATEAELHPTAPEDVANMSFTGSLSELNKLFYTRGWTNGTPIIPPTAEAVEEMLTGTDLPRDYIVAKLPPLLGEATVEKIAINAVMAGCLPTYMPVLIAAVRGMASPLIALEGWTCSNAAWIPMSVISGPIQKDIGIYSGRAVLSPYYLPQNAIPRAIAYMVMNLTGVRPGLEDMSGIGTIGRFGVCIGDNEENPWGPLHVDYGFEAGDSVLTQFWPSDEERLMGNDAKTLLRNMCKIDAIGWDCGCMFMLAPENARTLADAGFTRQQVLDYVVEYNRINVAKGGTFNNHFPEGCIFPVDGGYSQKRFWSKKHMFLVVAGKIFNAAFSGGGDHGGPAMTKIELPTGWKDLVAKYSDFEPNYLKY